MALPTNPKAPVVPESMKNVYESYVMHDAWYSGDGRRLHAFYNGRLNTFWSRNPIVSKRSILHVPVAGDIASTSADLLFSEFPNIYIKEALDGTNSVAQRTLERLEEIMDNTGLYNKLLEAAETASALGGVYLKPMWDKSLIQYPMLSIAQADTAIPEFRMGMLVAVTFHKIVCKETHRNEDKYYRLLERHELSPNNKGTYNSVILNGLYCGTRHELGVKIPLTSLPETEYLPEFIDTGIEGLIVRYVPNRMPNKVIRGSQMGMSDFCGVENLMDALDEVYSSWMRDIRLGQARIFIPESYLEPKPDGTFKFDLDKEAYTSYAGNPSMDSNGITVQQFAIRMEEHRQTATSLLERIISNAGYSLQTFGLELDKAESGKALSIRERKTYITTSKKKRYWEPAIADMLYILLQIDALHLGSGIEPMKPIVELVTPNTEDILSKAQSLQFLDTANAISTETKVRMVNPDWTDEQIQAEVDKILEEKGLSTTNKPSEPVAQPSVQSVTDGIDDNANGGTPTV